MISLFILIDNHALKDYFKYLNY